MTPKNDARKGEMRHEAAIASATAGGNAAGGRRIVGPGTRLKRLLKLRNGVEATKQNLYAYAHSVCSDRVTNCTPSVETSQRAEPDSPRTGRTLRSALWRLSVDDLHDQRRGGGRGRTGIPARLIVNCIGAF